jgi:hypothetical protein
MRSPKEFRFTDLLSPDFYKRGPGRPRLPSWDEIMPWETILGSDACREAEARAFWVRWQRRHHGRRADQERNRSLLEGYRAAKSQGVTMRAFVKKWFHEQHGREATPDDVSTVERQIDRLLKK